MNCGGCESEDIGDGYSPNVLISAKEVRTSDDFVKSLPRNGSETKDTFSELLLSSRSGFDQLSTRPTTGKILAGSPEVEAQSESTSPDTPPQK
jgi:hypothetical protein